jgi:hypothetical protein
VCDCSIIFHKNVLAPLSLLIILVCPNVYITTLVPLLALPLLSHLFVYLPRIVLPSRHIDFVNFRVKMLGVSILVKYCYVATVCWSSISHHGEWKGCALIIDTKKRGAVENSIYEKSYSCERSIVIGIILISYLT